MMKHQRFTTIGILALLLAFTVSYRSSSQLANPVSPISLSGDLVLFLNDLPIPGRDTEAFVAPSQADIATWRQALGALLTEQYETAAQLADPLGYDVIEFTDLERDKTYYVFRERNHARGLGTYVYNPAACRLLSIEAPHAGGDLHTLPQSIVLFVDLNAVTLLIAGTHRCANSQPSPCDGTTSVCTGSRAPHPISDVAHSTKNFFQPAHEEMARRLPGVVSISVHGFNWRTGDPDLIISNGTSGDRPESLTIRLADLYNQMFDQLGIPLQAGSCNQVGGPTRLCGGTNVQGRFVNGSMDVCHQGVLTVSGRERFIHIEQSCALRQMSSCGRPAAVPYQATVAVFAAVFPCLPVQ